MQNIADIVGAGTTVPLANPNITARWVNIAVTGAGTVRVGGSDTSVSKGLPVLAGGYDFAPYDSPLQCYNLRDIYVYVPVGATVSANYEPFN